MKTLIRWVGLTAVLGWAVPLWSQVPPLLNYQGRVTANGTNFSGAGQFKFALVNGAGTLSFWSNDGTSNGGGAPNSPVTLPVSNGLFSVMLGDTNLAQMTVAIPLNTFTNPDVRLRLWFNDGVTGFQQLAPDQRLGSVGYAMQSASAALALGVAPGGVSNTMLQNSTVTVTAGAGLSGGGSVPLGGNTALAANLNRDATLLGNGGTSPLGLNLANPNTWTAAQTFSSLINGSISGTAAGFTGPLAGDVTGTQSATVITNLNANRIAGLFKWQIVSGTSQQVQPNTGYLLTNAAQVTVMLPTNAAIGDTFRLSAPGPGGWKLAQIAGQSIYAGNFGTLDIGLTWAPSGPSANWSAVASSADGVKLVAAVNGGQVYTSTDSGATWTAHGSSANWSCVASSADGTRLAAAVNGGQLYTSSDLGVTWTARDSARAWAAVASSADGLRLVASVNGGNLYTSSDFGATWTPRTFSASWLGVASSADGTELVAALNGGQLYTSKDSGATWSPHGPANNWRSVASSADGMKLAAGINNGQIYTSSDGGTNWLGRPTGSRSWYGIASSIDGMKLAAVANGGQIYISTDFGASWTARDNNRAWQSVAGSCQGDKLVAVVNGGQVYLAAAPAVSSGTTTTPGSNGYLAGGQGTAIELQYLGSSQFVTLSHEGQVFAY